MHWGKWLLIAGISNSYRTVPIFPCVLCDFVPQSMDRHRRCHAAIPAMALHPEEQRVKFMSVNGLLASPLAKHKRQVEACRDFWSEEEKLTFKRV